LFGINGQNYRNWKKKQ